MSDAQYAQYLLERQGLSLLQSDEGFIAFKISEKECFLSDIFIEKSKRQTGAGKKLLSLLFSQAVEHGCESVSANIYTWDPNANSTLRAALACGFDLKSSGPNVLLITKDIRGEK